MKKARAGRAKRRMEERKKLEAMTEEEQIAYKKHIQTRSLKSRVQLALWDYKMRQYPRMKYNLLKDLLYERKQEISRMQENSSDKEQFEKELEQIEVTLNGISS